MAIWTSKEADILMDKYPAEGAEGVRRLIPSRTISAINAKAKALGIIWLNKPDPNLIILDTDTNTVTIPVGKKLRVYRTHTVEDENGMINLEWQISGSCLKAFDSDIKNNRIDYKEGYMEVEAVRPGFAKVHSGGGTVEIEEMLIYCK